MTAGGENYNVFNKNILFYLFTKNKTKQYDNTGLLLLLLLLTVPKFENKKSNGKFQTPPQKNKKYVLNNLCILEGV